ncbi:hypothetical protein ACIQAC_00640 [Streptomyces sp. NPDC088387]|uniref:hypothetical protein n=1 Tax=Streptomyces sp. NPDC088387 TaxID=3365859 RepID=UPI0038265E0D
MSSPSPLLVAPAALWTLVAGTALLATIVTAERARRRDADAVAWEPYGFDSWVALPAALVAYALAAAVADRFSLGAAAFAVLWPAMAATCLTYMAGKYAPSWPRWGSPAFAAVGAGLYGSLPL